jgi:archaellum biogenesis protein FlaJ (TadC family)
MAGRCDCAGFVTLAKVQKVITETYMTFADTYAFWAKKGEHEKMQKFLEKLNAHGVNSGEFLMKVKEDCETNISSVLVGV